MEFVFFLLYPDCPSSTCARKNEIKREDIKCVLFRSGQEYSKADFIAKRGVDTSEKGAVNTCDRKMGVHVTNRIRRNLGDAMLKDAARHQRQYALQKLGCKPLLEENLSGC